jgi:hypothetical protein
MREPDTLTAQDLIYAAKALRQSARIAEREAADPEFTSVRATFERAAREQDALAAKRGECMGTIATAVSSSPILHLLRAPAGAACSLPMAPGRKRGVADPLKPIDEPRWLVIRNRCRQALEYRELWPGSDLRGALEAECARRAAEGWHVEDIPANCAFCFCHRGKERVCISIECFEPGAAGLGHG